MSDAARRVFGRRPLLVALLTVGGLLSGLLGDGLRDVLSWLTLGVPLPLIAWHAGRPRRPHGSALTRPR